MATQAAGPRCSQSNGKDNEYGPQESQTKVIVSWARDKAICQGGMWGGRETQEGGDTLADSLCCTAETNTTL